MSAVLQMEFDRDRIADMSMKRDWVKTTPRDDTMAIAHAALNDTIENGGTFVIVVSDTKITLVQRAEAEEV